MEKSSVVSLQELYSQIGEGGSLLGKQPVKQNRPENKSIHLFVSLVPMFICLSTDFSANSLSPLTWKPFTLRDQSLKEVWDGVKAAVVFQLSSVHRVASGLVAQVSRLSLTEASIHWPSTCTRMPVAVYIFLVCIFLLKLLAHGYKVGSDPVHSIPQPARHIWGNFFTYTSVFLSIQEK